MGILTDLKVFDGVLGTIIAIIVLILFLVWGLQSQNFLLAAICIGAMGGLVHEIAQSGGRYMLPHMDGTNFVLGGLMGVVDGAIAGLLLVQGQVMPISNATMFYATAFLAGLALKGVNDAIQPKTA